MPEIEFKGKQRIHAHHLTIPHRPLVPDDSKSWNAQGLDDNVIIQGDNLDALKALMPLYAGQVDCVFIDPPYNTGNEGWVYNDKVNSPLMKEWLNKAVDLDDLERHDKWLCMMWPRIHLLKELLADDGAIFISIDDNEQHHLRMLMNEIFKEENFVANIIWHHRKSSQNDIDVSLSHNHILCYAKDRKRFSFNSGDVDESKFSNPDKDDRGPWVADPMDAPNVRENLTYEIVNPNTGDSHWPPQGRCWRFSPERFEEALKDGRILFGKSGKAKPQYKRFLEEALKKGTSIFTIWNDVGTATEGTKELQTIFDTKEVFSTPKPSDLLEKIIEITTNENAIVLDSFAGSGTTAQAVLSLNKKDGGARKFILVECEEYADTTTAERVRRVIDGVPKAKNENLKHGLGGSFTYCTLGEPMDIEGLLTGTNLPSYQTLAAHLLYTAESVQQSPDLLEIQNEDGLFYETKEKDYYLLYKPDIEWLRSNEAMLNSERARRIKEKNEKKGRTAVVFAPGKFMGQRTLTASGITFSQLPYDMKLGG